MMPDALILMGRQSRYLAQVSGFTLAYRLTYPYLFPSFRWEQTFDVIMDGLWIASP